MQTTSTQSATPESVGGLALACVAHMIWGTYPVLSKRLLNDIHPFSLLALGYAIAFLFGLLVWRDAFASRPWLRRSWWLLLAVVSARAITNILSVRYTLAIYVQMINLSTPFAVALLGSALFKEPVPPRTWSALAICTFGSILMLTGGTTDSWRWSSSDTLGIGLALASTICLAFYMLLTRYNQRAAGETSSHVFVHQALILGLVGAAASLGSGETWSNWSQLSTTTWLLFAVFVGLNLVGGNLIQIAALARIPTARFSTLVGIRLIAALSVAALLLGEALQSLAQVIGAGLVLGGVTWYVLKRQTAPQSG